MQKRKKTILSKETLTLGNLWKIAKILLAFLFIFLVFSKTDITTIKALKIKYAWVLISLFLFLLLSIIKTSQYYFLTNRQVPYLHMFRVVIWQNGISNFIANSAGIISYITMLKVEQNVKLTRSSIAFLITKIGDLLAIALYLSVSAWVVWKEIGQMQWMTILLIIGILAGLLIFLLIVLWREKFVNYIERITLWVKINHLAPIKKGIEILRLLAQEEQGPIFAMLRVGALLSLVYMTITMMFAFASMRIFDVSITTWEIIYVAALMQLLSLIPIQVFGGLGVTEVTSVYLYSLFGFDQTEMSAIMLGLRALFYIMNAVALLYLPFDALIQRYNKTYESK